jgi:serine protease Do
LVTGVRLSGQHAPAASPIPAGAHNAVMMRTPFILASLAALSLAAGCAREDDLPTTTTAPDALQSSLQRTSNLVETQGPTRGTGGSGFQELPDFTGLVERYGDAVVNVDVIGTAERPGGANGDPLAEFFRRFGIPGPEGGGQGGAPVMRGSGSGFIVTADGYILTNAHVVGEADEITVRLTDRREFSAKVIGVDARTDVAVIKIDAKDLPVVSIGDPSKLKTGEWVLAIGSPFGLANTATAGIVSATSRSVGGGSPVPFIQTDVAVNPGNSGGPLFNLNGEVVGINSMIFSQSGGYMGISFAVPIDEAMQVRDQLVKHGRVVRGRIGVGAQDVDAALARSFKLDRPRGALVSSVDPDGPADDAGVEPGDVILGVNGKEIDQSADLSNNIADIQPGQEAKLAVWRDGKQRNITVKVEQLQEPQERVAGAARPRGGNRGEEDVRLGLVVRPLTQEEQRMAETEGEVVVQEVQGSAARAGLQPGDIILAVNNQVVNSVQDLRAAAGKLNKGDAAALLVERDGAQIFVPVRAG